MANTFIAVDCTYDVHTEYISVRDFPDASFCVEGGKEGGSFSF